ETFYKYLEMFGFGKATGVDYPGESDGILADYQDWSEVQEANISFGQGISVTTIQMASFYGMIASGGTYVQPHFLIGYPNSDETVEYDKTQMLTTDVCDQLTDMLTGVVTDGTGAAAAVEGYTVAGKTGTAQKITDSGEYSEGAYVISFDGYLANSSSSLACVVSIDNPETSAAMPVFSSVMEYAAQRYGITNNDSSSSSSSDSGSSSE
ncbi:MAG: penicillin-binding transpeptidase domain-containing protein, partial [Coriobacteriales bacterium]